MKKIIELDTRDIIEAIAEKYNVTTEQINLMATKTYVGYYDEEKIVITATVKDK